MNLDSNQEHQLRHLVRIFLEENQKLNLSAHRTPESCWALNVLDSLALLDALPHYQLPATSYKLIDIGTGGGFPALPLAVMRPEWSFTVFDATRKKVEAVQRMINVLQATSYKLQAHCLVGRAEELGHQEDLRESFGLVLARAVAELPTLLELMSPFARAGGRLVCWKSSNIEGELKASSHAQAELQCMYRMNHLYNLGSEHGKRQLLIFEKVGSLPEKYPRRVGIPKKKPL